MDINFNFNMPDFSFDDGLDMDIDIDFDDEISDFGETEKAGDGFRYYGDAVERTFRAVNLNMYDEGRVYGRYDMPMLEPCSAIPRELIDFNAMIGLERRVDGVHFFIDDYRFERIWREPVRYALLLAQRTRCVLTPDFSLYMDMPEAMKIWNVYRSRLIGQIMQDYGSQVIPTLSWAEPKSYEYCFDGVPERSTVAVSTVGVMRSDDAKAIWRHGMTAALERLRPTDVIIYGKMMDGFDFGDVNVHHYSARKWR